jgi:hypothetical protein
VGKQASPEKFYLGSWRAGQPWNISCWKAEAAFTWDFDGTGTAYFIIWRAYPVSWLLPGMLIYKHLQPSYFLYLECYSEFYAGQTTFYFYLGCWRAGPALKNRKETCPDLQGISFPIAGLYPKYNKRNSPILDCCIFPAATLPSPHYRFLGDKMRGREQYQERKGTRNSNVSLRQVLANLTVILKLKVRHCSALDVPKLPTA